MPLAGAATTPRFTKESKEAYEQQLNKGEIKEGTFNKKLRNLHVELKSGRLFLYHYGKKESKKLTSDLEKKHVKVTVLNATAAGKEAKSAPKPAHKLRYIAGGILLAVIVIVGIVLLVNRRRGRDE
ncbi:MAG: hypothetical protein ACYDC2_01075 [Solirubrobacteraceae bacterium]